MKRIIYRLLASALCCSMFFSNRVIYAADDTVANHFTTQVEEEPQDATDEPTGNPDNVEEQDQNTESSLPETNTADEIEDSSDVTGTDTVNTEAVFEEGEEEQEDVPQITEEPEENTEIEEANKDVMQLRGAAATAPKDVWVEISFADGDPSYTIYGFPRSNNNYELYLPGNVDVEDCRLYWDGDAHVEYDGTVYESGNCPIPNANTNISKTYTFKNESQTLGTFNIITYKGSSGVPPVFIQIDETKGTIAAMDGDKNHDLSCSGTININGAWYVLEKMKGRGNATWSDSEDKKPYNVTLGQKINFPGIDSKKTDKWSLLAEALDHSLLCNRAGFYLGYQLGIAQDTASADVWMNGEYQGCYTITPKTDSFVDKNGFMIEQDNYKETKTVAQGGDPQFSLDGLITHVQGWSSSFNLITVKKIGKALLSDDKPETKEYVATEIIKPWLQDAWDAIRSSNGFNEKGKYYTDYIDIESFAKMYLIHEYVKSYDVCAGSLLFYRDGMTDDKKLIAGPLWDLDNALGATYRNFDLGYADNPKRSDRRSAEGSFIQNISYNGDLNDEYKTSIYKKLFKHEDFKREVEYQYSLYHEAFENLPQAYNQLMAEIEDSARMNHYKVDDIPGVKLQNDNYQGNNHKYAQETTLGSGQYQQTYLETNNSRTDWKNYADNLGTFIRVRSLWFENNWTVSEKYVSFDADNGTIVTHQKVASGNTVSKPSPDPTKEGYKFLGWYQVIDPSEGTTDKQSFDFNTVITESITLKALWAPDNAIIAREATLVLEGLIGVRFTMFVPNPETTTIKVTIHRDKGVEEDYEIPDSDIKKISQSGEERYQYVVKVAAKEMNDMIELHFYDDNGDEIQVVSNKGTVVENVQYSVSTYLKNKSGTDNEKLKKVIQAMRAYGDCAQIYFNYRANEAGEIALEDVDTETLEDHKASMIGENLEGLRVSSCTLVLESETVVRYSLKTLDNHAIDDYVFILDNDEVQPTQYGDTWRIEAKNIAAKDLDEIHTLKVTQRSSNSDVSVTYIYGPEAYWYNKLMKSTSSDNIKNMCKSMYWYNQAANEYFDGR